MSTIKSILLSSVIMIAALHAVSVIANQGHTDSQCLGIDYGARSSGIHLELLSKQTSADLDRKLPVQTSCGADHLTDHCECAAAYQKNFRHHL